MDTLNNFRDCLATDNTGTTILGSRLGVDITVVRLRPGRGGRENGERFSLIQTSETASHRLIFSGHCGQFSPAVKRSEVKADRSSTSSAEANTALKITFAPLCNFVACRGSA